MIVIVCFLAIVTTSRATPVESYLSFDDDYFKRQDHCKPECPCVMNGILYDDGDSWHPKDNPCITYKCRNAFYSAVAQGCDFKGECKPRNSTWTEKCISYRCNFLNERIGVYSLIEGGCEDDHGNCYKVGQRTTKACDVYECQIVDTCYKLVLISKGCLFQRECKALNSFWHFNCAIYQCVQKKERTLYYQRYGEIMYWPHGDYALLETSTGCPIDVDEEWKTGTRIHWSNGNSDISIPFDLAGRYKKIGFEHKFCTHIDVYDTALIPRYQTYWDPGKYCIFRKNGKCPAGFQDGYIGMDDFDDLDIGNSLTGELPDGDYGKDTGFYFCCRNDGHLQEAIVLPKEKPFMLFMSDGASDCQTVGGMESKKEYFEFDDDDKDQKRFTKGAIPLMKDCDNNTMIYFCYYTPMDCGCKDVDGTLVQVGATLKKGCVTYKCVQKLGTRYLQVVKGGCLVDKECKDENSTWSESSGDICKMKTCKRQIDSNGFLIFQDVTVKQGCRDGDSCRDVGFVKKRGCYEMRCQVHSTTKEPYFYMTKAGCSDGKGGCIPLGTKFTRNCIQYQCHKGKTACGATFIKGGCKFGNECKAVGSTWESSSCIIYRCDMTTNGTSVILRTSVEKLRCKMDGKCYDVGQTVKYGCFRKKCVADANKKSCHSGLIIDSCPWKGGKCKKINSTWTENCVTYKCSVNDTSYSVEPEEIRCQYKGKCIKKGSTVKMNCTEKICNVKKISNTKYSAGLQNYITACADPNGNCIALNETIYEKCVTYKCEKKPGYYPALLPQKADCRYNGVCKENDTEWSDPARCLTLKCMASISKDYRVTMKISPAEIGCKDGKICRKENESWIVGCYKKTCTVIRLNNEYRIRVPTKYNSCRGPSGKCIPVNQSYEKNCVTYQCLQDSKGILRLKPFRSGCTDRTGVCRGINYKYDKSCVTYKCVNTTKGPRFEPVEVGCTCTGVCKKNGAEWTDKKTCVTTKCIASIGPNYAIKMKTQPIKAGCKIGGVCREANESWTEGCFEKKCLVTITGQRVSYRISNRLRGCLDGNGNCREIGYEYDKNCVTYRCRAMGNSPRFEPVDAGCVCSGVCQKNGAEWTESENCATKKCIASISPDYKISMHTKTIKAGCKVKGVCRPANSSWIDGCYTKTCLVTTTNRRMSIKISTKRNGCIGPNKNCMALGDTYVRNCITFKCVSGSRGPQITAAKASCRFEGRCLDNGKSSVKNCYKKTCSIYRHGNGFKQSISSSKTGCKIGNNCYEVGSTWKHTSKTGCAILRCTRTMRPEIQQQLCLDADGICRFVGEKGFRVKHRGTFVYCDCVAYGNRSRMKCRAANSFG